MILRPQKGPQEKFLSTTADIAIYGGAAGGGKTYALLLEPLRHMNVDGYSATIFRRNATQITIDGGLLDESMSIYGFLKNAVFKSSPQPHWIFGGKARVSFRHIDGDRDLPKWQDSQICFIGFDELTHVSEFTFFISDKNLTCRLFCAKFELLKIKSTQPSRQAQIYFSRLIVFCQIQGADFL